MVLKVVGYGFYLEHHWPTHFMVFVKLDALVRTLYFINHIL